MSKSLCAHSTCGSCASLLGSSAHCCGCLSAGADVQVMVLQDEPQRGQFCWKTSQYKSTLCLFIKSWRWSTVVAERQGSVVQIQETWHGSFDGVEVMGVESSAPPDLCPRCRVQHGQNLVRNTIDERTAGIDNASRMEWMARRRDRK